MTNNIPLHNAIRKYGIENLEWKEIATCLTNENDLNELEKYFIKELNTIFPFGYNVKPGGDGWPKGKPAVGKRAKGVPNTGKVKKGKDCIHNKEVVSINIKTKEMKEYYSIRDAENQTNSTNGHITSCCKKRRKSHNGYIWFYKTDL